MQGWPKVGFNPLYIDRILTTKRNTYVYQRWNYRFLHFHLFRDWPSHYPCFCLYFSCDFCVKVKETAIFWAMA